MGSASAGENLRDFRCDNARRDRACMLQVFAAVASMRHRLLVHGPGAAAGACTAIALAGR